MGYLAGKLVIQKVKRNTKKAYGEYHDEILIFFSAHLDLKWSRGLTVLAPKYLLNNVSK